MEMTTNTDISSGSVGKNTSLDSDMTLFGTYTAQCRDSEGNLKWEESFPNLVTTAGKIDALDKYLAGSAYTAAFYIGLISSVSYTNVVVADTMSSHAGWLEAGGANAPTYTGARQTTSWSGASGVGPTNKVASAVNYSITGSGTVKGCFLTTVATKDGTTGTLYSAGLFSGGDKVVASADTLSVTYTASIT